MSQHFSFWPPGLPPNPGVSTRSIEPPVLVGTQSFFAYRRLFALEAPPCCQACAAGAQRQLVGSSAFVPVDGSVLFEGNPTNGGFLSVFLVTAHKGRLKKTGHQHGARFTVQLPDSRPGMSRLVGGLGKETGKRIGTVPHVDTTGDFGMAGAVFRRE